MKTVKDIQEFIYSRCGLKTSVRKGTGSMKGYLIVIPIFQNGSYPTLPFDLVQAIKPMLTDFDNEPHPVFCSSSGISVYLINDDRVIFKKESKPKATEKMTVRTWGSKNSQMRLDKRAAANAKRMNRGGTARYW